MMCENAFRPLPELFHTGPQTLDVPLLKGVKRLPMFCDNYP